MKSFKVFILFLLIFVVYLGVATRFTYKPKWVLDYYNPLTQSFLHGRFDISNPGITHDLIYFHQKWYVIWGILPSLLLIPFQMIKGRFIPTVYVTIFFASLNVCAVYLLLCRLKREFFPSLKTYEIILILMLFSFGTSQFYVGTLGSVWHVNQMVTFSFGTVGLYIIFKKKRTLRDYIFSSLLFSSAAIGRTVSLTLIILPILLYMNEFLLRKNSLIRRLMMFKRALMIFGIPLFLFVSILFIYNFVRFLNPFEYGYTYIQDPPFTQIRLKNGTMSYLNIPNNVWYMFFEIPRMSFQNKITLDFNLMGNSIFFLTPPFLAIFLANPFTKRKSKFFINPYVMSLWITALLTLIPVLLFYSTGWMQFGYRYSLDITVIFLILSLFGVKGRLNILYILGIFFSIFMYSMGINALM